VNFPFIVRNTLVAPAYGVYSQYLSSYDISEKLNEIEAINKITKLGIL
jgi:hypothetical protein